MKICRYSDVSSFQYGLVVGMIDIKSGTFIGTFCSNMEDVSAQMVIVGKLVLRKV